MCDGQMANGYASCATALNVFAMVDRCPHRDFNLSSGDMVAPGVIECPWHGAQFDCRTGAALQGSRNRRIDCCIAVRIENGEVFVGTSQEFDMSSHVLQESPHSMHASPNALRRTRRWRRAPTFHCSPTIPSCTTSTRPQLHRSHAPCLMRSATSTSIRNANPHRGAYALSAAATDAYHDARVKVASISWRGRLLTR